MQELDVVRLQKCVDTQLPVERFFILGGFAAVVVGQLVVGKLLAEPAQVRVRPSVSRTASTGTPATS